MRSTHGFSLVLAVLLATGCQSISYSEGRASSGRPKGATAVQALIGVSEFSQLDFERESPGNPGEIAKADLSTMPALGFAGQYALGGDKLEFGLDGGVLFSWEGDRETVTFSTGGGTGVVVIDRELLVIDLFFGPYISMIVADNLRLYGAVGADMMWGDADYEDELTSESDSTFGYGGSARAGLELRMADGSFLGVGGRYVSTELDFDDTIGKIDVEGWQAFLTFTQGF